MPPSSVVVLLLLLCVVSSVCFSCGGEAFDWVQFVYFGNSIAGQVSGTAMWECWHGRLFSRDRVRIGATGKTMWRCWLGRPLGLDRETQIILGKVYVEVLALPPSRTGPSQWAPE